MAKRRRSRRDFLKESAIAGGGLIAGSFRSRGALASGETGIRPANLRCEYRENPLGIDALRPRLSWVLESGGPLERGQRQSAYHILAANREDLLRSGRGDLWDTGKIASDQSTHVEYAGKTLASGQPVWWKVRVWDGSGAPSPWSETAQWSMGLLRREDWKGNWIGRDGGAGKPQELLHARWIWSSAPGGGICYFRRQFTVPAPGVDDALVNIVASGDSTLYVNGEPAGKGHGIKSPIAQDITEMLKPGPNVIGLKVSGAANGPSGVLGALQIELVGEERMAIHTDQEWQASRSERSGWKAPGFNTAGWEPVKVLGGYGLAPWGEVGYAQHRVLPARLLRKEFHAGQAVRRATLYFAGLGLSEAYLNGEKVSADVLSPALSDYDKRVFYRTYDVTGHVRRGKNALGVILGNGRFFAPRYTAPTATRTFGYPKLLLQLELEDGAGNVQRIVSDGSWKLTTAGPIRANNVYDGETYDARQQMEGWSRPGFADSGWQSAQQVEAPAGVLSAQMIEPIRVTRTLKPLKITQPKPGNYIFDMGQNMVGWCRLRVSGPRGTKVSLRHAETLRPDGTLYLNNLRSARATDTYILKKRGTEIYEPRFTYHGFRYVELKGFPGEPTLEALEGRVVHDALPEHARFATSESLINRIYKNVLWGTGGNYRSIPTDCPQRDERQGWLGDRSAESRGESFLFEVAPFYAKWVGDIHDSQNENDSVSDVSPAYWPLYNDNVTWPASFFIVAAHMYDQYGDVRTIEKHYDGMKKWITHMRTYIQNGLMPRDTYGDWCVPPKSLTLIHSKDPARQTDATVLGTTYFYYLLRLMARNATLLQKPDDARDFSGRAEKMRQAFHERYYHADRGEYSNGSQTSSILPLAFGMVPESEKNKVLDALVRKIRVQSKSHIGSGLIGCQWLMQLLTANGLVDLAYEIARQKTYPSWGYMISRGATTIWELWNGDTANPAMNSRNHLMLVGDLVTWFYESLAGIRSDPDNPGFKHIVMHPVLPDGLVFVRASHRSPYGEIVSDWSREKNEFRWNITVPVNTTATVYVPAKDAGSVSEGRNPAQRARGVRLLREQEGRAVYELGSGSYRFVSQITSRNAARLGGAPG